MVLLSRRSFLLGAAGVTLSASGVGAYAMGVEPMLLLDVTSYSLTPAGWPADLSLKIVALADFHACEPWMPVDRLLQICGLANNLQPDLIVLLGDYNGGHDYVTAPVMPEAWGGALSMLRAPLGVFGVLGNHDIWHGALPRMRGDGGESVRRALRDASVTVLENSGQRLFKDGKPFWLLGLADQLANRIRAGQFRGDDDLPGTLALLKDDAPAILLAHEPHVFGRVPKRVGLTLCGHTHGGQVNLPFIGSPVARRTTRYVYGHFHENDRHLIVSGGLGASIFPVRFRRPPEIVQIQIGRPATTDVAARR
ncbi:MAG: metallophosphoesterase [Beijerinckiaceae bacterium]|jgi:uncharacterized protein|nr:metallophosphoesterase [Beijerinckiaceae bacterium]